MNKLKKLLFKCLIVPILFVIAVCIIGLEKLYNCCKRFNYLRNNPWMSPDIVGYEVEEECPNCKHVTKINIPRSTIEDYGIFSMRIISYICKECNKYNEAEHYRKLIKKFADENENNLFNAYLIDKKIYKYLYNNLRVIKIEELNKKLKDEYFSKDMLVTKQTELNGKKGKPVKKKKM